MHIQNSRLLLNFNYTYSPYNLFPYVRSILHSRIEHIRHTKAGTREELEN